MNNKKKTKQPWPNSIFDEYLKTQVHRDHTVVIGYIGYGKSVLLKKQVHMMHRKGNFARVFDVTGEFSGVTHACGGTVINCSGEDGMLNPLEILQAGDDEATNFSRHIAKLITFYCCYVPDAADKELCILQNMLRVFYAKCGLSPKGIRPITRLPAGRYPILSDLRTFLDEQIRETSEGRQEKILTKIKVGIETILSQDGHLFNGYTTMEDVKDCKIVTYDLSMLNNMEPAVMDAIFVNLISLCWAHCIENGRSRREQPVSDFLILINDSQNWINTKKALMLDLITVYLGETRKYSGKVMLSAPSIQDFMPDGLESPSVNKLKSILNLIECQVIFHQDAAALPYLDEVLGTPLTSAQRSAIPELGIGDMLLLLDRDRCLKVGKDPDTAEKQSAWSNGQREKA